jgi:hypothetical protein
MATYASRPALGVRVRGIASARFAVPLGLALLAALSLLLRVGEMGIGFWIDEGLSVGIADRPLSDIPRVMRQDGSPPLYYVLLHFWMRMAGTSEPGARTLSLLFATVAIPASFWAAKALFGTRAGWVAAVLAATNPFMTQYAQEARMYAFVALLGTVACACLARALIGSAPERERRPWAIGAAVALAAMFYTHNWCLFFAMAWGATWLALLWRAEGEARRALLRAGLLAFGGALVLWLPWVPTFAYQVVHTGAPWSQSPSVSALLGVPGQLLGTVAQGVIALTAGAGVGALLTRGEQARARVALILLAVGAATVLIAWLVSQASPAWANRYLAVGLGPVLLAAAGGLAHAGRLGVAGLVIVAVMGIGDGAPSQKSNVRDVAQAIRPSLSPGDLVVSTQPEQIPVLHHYLPAGLRFATLTGPIRDLGVTDWRDGTQRLDRVSAARDLRPLLDRLPVGKRLVLVSPIFSDVRQWRAPWTKRVRIHSYEWEQYLSNDARFMITSTEPPPPVTEPGPIPLEATVYVKTRR